MSRNVEELLREGIDRLAATTAATATTATTDPTTPATLLHRARQHNRRRRQAIAGAIAAGTAAVAAAAVIAATAGPGANPNALHGQTITYVATRAEQALAHLDQSHAIEIDTTDDRNGAFGFTVLNTAVTPTGNPQVRTVLSTVHASSEVDWTYNGSLSAAWLLRGRETRLHLDRRGAGPLRCRLPGPRTLAQSADRWAERTGSRPQL